MTAATSSRAEVPLWSVRGVRAGCDPRVLLSLGVPPWLRRGELSEADARRDGFVLANLELGWS